MGLSLSHASTEYCKCGNCKVLPTREENVCCKEIKHCPHLLKGKICFMIFHSPMPHFSDMKCICDHPLVSSILNKEILRIQLLTLWDTTRSSADINNRCLPCFYFFSFNYTELVLRNLRFSSYRSIYFWIYGKKNPTKKFRLALPSCLVSLVREMYPEDTGVYTGFINKLPGILEAFLDMIIIWYHFSFQYRKRRGEPEFLHGLAYSGEFSCD